MRPLVLLSVLLGACAPSDLPAEKSDVDADPPVEDSGAVDGGGDAGGDSTDATDGTDGTDATDGADGADATDGADGSDGGDTAEPPPDPIDLRDDGGGAWDVLEAAVTLSDGAELGYLMYQPETATFEGLVVLAHGFSRASDQMAGLAGRLASYGFVVITPDLLHSNAFDVDPEANADELNQLVADLGGPPTLWAGHSNGAIVALLGAADADDPRGLLGLDPVESFGGDSSGVAGGLSGVWTGALLGESGFCNAYNSGAAAYAAADDALLWRVTEADHCDFEDPSDSLCTFSCGGSNDRFTDSEINDSIGGLAVAWALGAGLGDASVDEWWTEPGYWNAELRAAGAISAT